MHAAKVSYTHTTEDGFAAKQEDDLFIIPDSRNV